MTPTEHARRVAEALIETIRAGGSADDYAYWSRRLEAEFAEAIAQEREACAARCSAVAEAWMRQVREAERIESPNVRRYRAVADAWLSAAEDIRARANVPQSAQITVGNVEIETT